MTSTSTRTISLVSLATAALMLAACSTTTTQSFNTVQNSRVQASEIAVDADFGKYDTLNAADMGIYFPSHAKTSDEEQQRIRDIFRAAFLGELEGYTVVRNQQGPKILTVEATLLDFRNATADDVMAVRHGLRDMTVPGSLVFLMELKDSRSGEVLGRAADSAAAPAISTSDDIETDWDAIESAAARWASLFRQFLDENLDQ